MIPMQTERPIESRTATLFNANLRLIAPRLVDYQCELTAIVQSVESDEDCAKALIKYANRRQQDPEIEIETVHHAAVYLGVIDTKHFVINHLLLDTAHTTRTQQLQMLIRAKLVTELFKTNGPMNKDLAFVGAFLAHKKLLKHRSPEDCIQVFRLDEKRHDALINLDYGLRQTIEQAIVIETRCNPGSAQRRRMPRDVEHLYHDALYWANCIIMAR